jgi:hypothetical protein
VTPVGIVKVTDVPVNFTSGVEIGVPAAGAAAEVHEVPFEVSKLPLDPGVTPPVVVMKVPVAAGKVITLDPETAGACKVMEPLVSPAIMTWLIALTTFVQKRQ